MPFIPDQPTQGFKPDERLATPGFQADQTAREPLSVAEVAIESVRREQEAIREFEADPGQIAEYEQAQRFRQLPLARQGVRFLALGPDPMRPPAEDEKYFQDMYAIGRQGLPEDEAETLRLEVTTQYTSNRIRQIHEVLANKERAELGLIEAEKLRGRFGAKTWRRWERGVAMVVGGGFHLMEEITKLADAVSPGVGKSGLAYLADELGETARWYHKALQQPEMQPAIDNMFDKYAGGMVETGPFMLAAFAPAVMSGGAAIPTTIGGFLAAYAVEGNNIYQTALDQGMPEHEARMRGMVGGLINGGIEIAGGGAGKYLKGKAAAKTLTKLQKAKKFGRRALRNALKEGLMEELPQEMVSMIAGSDVPLKEDGTVDWDETADRLVDSAIMGTLLGGFADGMVQLSNLSYEAQQMKRDDLIEDTAEVLAEDVVEREKETMPPIGGPGIFETAEARFRREAAEALVERYGVTGQEALAMLEQERTGAVAGTQISGMSNPQALSAYLETQDKTKGSTPTQRMNRSGWVKLRETLGKIHATWDAKTKDIARYMEKLDGMSKGPMYNFFVRRGRQARYELKDRVDALTTDTMEELRTAGLKPEWSRDAETVAEGVNLTTANKIMIAAAAGNQHQMRQIVEGMGIAEETVADIIDGLGKAELKVVEVIRNKLDALQNDPELAQAIEAMGLKPEDIFREVDYMTMYRTDVEAGGFDPFDAMMDPFRPEGAPKPESKMFQEREPGAVGEINMDPIEGLLTTLQRIEKVKVMAPMAAEFAEVINDNRFKQSLNRATYGQGLPTLNKWAKETIQGYVTPGTGIVTRINRALRRNARRYLLGYNAVTASIQPLSLFGTWAANSRVASYTLQNAISLPRNYKAVREFVQENSPQLKTRKLYQTRMNKEAWVKHMEGPKGFKDKAFNWIQAVDEYTVTLAWKSLYDAAMDPKGMNLDSDRAAEFADDWIAKTQPMPDVMDLPEIFRGSEFAQTLTQFQRVPIQTWNLLTHDIVEQFQTGNISGAEAARRAVAALVIPAMLMSALRRGRLPKDGDEMLEDIALYGISTVPLAGAPIRNMMQGFDSYAPTSFIPLTEANKARQDLMRGDPRGVITHSLKALGAGTGTIPLQAIRTGEGAYDLMTGQTDDVRRLLYSEYALREND